MNCGQCALLNYGRDLAEGQTDAICSHRKPLAWPFANVDEEACSEYVPRYTGTLDRELWPLMQAEEVRQGFCCVCGRTAPLNQHHLVRRSAGKLFRDGKELDKPTITLCGSGNASGCHGLAHSYRLHFRMKDGGLQYLITAPMKYSTALKLRGWKPIHRANPWD